MISAQICLPKSNGKFQLFRYFNGKKINTIVIPKRYFFNKNTHVENVEKG
jgi:hypothetical protein